MLKAGFGRETSEFTSFLTSFREQFGEKCRALNQNLSNKGRMKYVCGRVVMCSLHGTRKDLLFFCYDEATRALTTNLNLNSEVVREGEGHED